MKQEEGFSTGSLLGAFLAVVALCAVVFSLGFFLGYRQGRPAATVASEQVASASDTSTDVNPPASAPSSASSDADGTAESTPSVSSGSTTESETGESPATAVPGAPETNSNAGPDARALESATVAHIPRGLLVQVAAVTNQQDASNVVSVLRSKNYPALVLTPQQAKAKDSFYRVVAGPYKSRTDAEKARQQLSAEGFKPFIR